MKFPPVLLMLLVVVVAAAAGCGSDEPGGGRTGPGGAGPGQGNAGARTPTAKSGGSAAKARGSCEVRVDGDITGSINGSGGPGSVGSDYWFSEDELKRALAVLKAEAETIDEAMKRDPRIYLLILNCGSGQDSISLVPSSESRYRDVPFKPGEYAIPAQGPLGGAKEPGEFNVLLTFHEASFRVAEPGKLRITKFDKSGIAGSFTFKAEEVHGEGAARSVSVNGTFNFACGSGDHCKRE